MIITILTGWASSDCAFRGPVTQVGRCGFIQAVPTKGVLRISAAPQPPTSNQIGCVYADGWDQSPCFKYCVSGGDKESLQVGLVLVGDERAEFC